MLPVVACTDVKKPTKNEIALALLSEDKATRVAMAARITKKRPPHRAANWTAPYVRLMLLVIFYQMLSTTKNNRAAARRLTVQWFSGRGIRVTEGQVLSAYNNHRPPNVTTVAEWNAWEAKAMQQCVDAENNSKVALSH